MAKMRGMAGIEQLGFSALAGGAIAAVLNVLLLLVAKGAGYTLIVKTGNMIIPRAISAVQVGFSCLIAALGAAALVWALLRWTRNSTMMFYRITGVLLLVSMAWPATVWVNRPVTRIILGVMHLIAAGAIIGTMQRMGVLKK